MKTILLFALTVISYAFTNAQNVGVGTSSPAGSAALDVTSINAGFLPPRMNTGQRDAIPAPVAGLIIYNTSTNAIEYYNGISWYNMTTAINANTSVKKLLGGTADQEYLMSGTKTTDGGYITCGYTQASNSGTLTGLISNGVTDATIVKLDGAGNIQWQRLLGGTGDDYTMYIIQATDGGYLAVGQSNSSNTGTLTGINNNGSSDVWVIKLDANGNVSWQKLLGGSLSDNAYNVQQTADGGYIIAANSQSSNTGTLSGITGNGNYDYWVIKLDNSGTLIWQKLLGGSASDFANSICLAPDGGYVIQGQSSSSNTGTLLGVTSNGNNDFLLVKLDINGNLQWQKLIGGSLFDLGSSVAATPDGGYIATGYSSSSNTGTLTGLTGNGGYDYWIIKMDGFGNIQWQKLFGGSVDDQPRRILATADGGYVIVGNSASSMTGTINITNNGSSDYFLLKISSTGILQWQKLYGGTGTEMAYDVSITTEGGYIMFGLAYSSGTGNLTGMSPYGFGDGFVLKVDKFGNPY